MNSYVIGIDQSTQGTKAMLFDENGSILLRLDKAHDQLIDSRGWVEHDPEVIYANTIELVRRLVEESKVDPQQIKTVGISNQRETALAWDRKNGKPVYNAIVWQCARGENICRKISDSGYADMIKEKTGIPLSPYFSAAKLAWIMQNVPLADELAKKGELCCGTMDSYLVFRLTNGEQFRTDYSNASRTQLFNVRDLEWDEEICGIFGIQQNSLPELTDSDGLFGETDFDGVLPKKIPIHGVLGDSHGALFGQGCLNRGMMKATYGTGSSIMMNVGEKPVFSNVGVVTSLAWKMNGKVNYVLEGNINYTGAVISWMKDKVGILSSPSESQSLAESAMVEDHTYLVPAFTGLGAPYWRSDVSAAFVGMSRTTGRAELVKAGLESIAYQISDIVLLMKEAAGISDIELRVDGGPTRNSWLMQFQSDILNCRVLIPQDEELSGIGAAYAAGIGAGVYSSSIFERMKYKKFDPDMDSALRDEKYHGWTEAVKMVLR